MSHFTVLVIGEDPEKQLQPYHEYECTGVEDEFVFFVEAKESKKDLEKEYNEQKEENQYDSFDQFMTDWHGYEKNKDGKYGRITNPNAKWDWYSLGGRWSNFFKLKGIGNSDQALKRNIDFEAMEKEKSDTAKANWDKVNDAWVNLPESRSWVQVREIDHKDDIDTARKVYNMQPRVKAFRKIFDHPFAEMGPYLMSRDEYILLKVKESFQTFAVVKDSIWYEKGEMGWFGISSNKKEEGEWDVEFSKLLKDLPDDTLLSVYDCHI